MKDHSIKHNKHRLMLTGNGQKGEKRLNAQRDDSFCSDDILSATPKQVIVLFATPKHINDSICTSFVPLIFYLQRQNGFL
jgi:hypothetical protein